MADNLPRRLSFPVQEVQESLNDDAEFGLCIRGMNARIQLRTGSQILDLRVVDGVVTEVRDDATGFLSYDILLEGSTETWLELMRSIPVPFYQEFWSAKFHHGFRIEGDLDLASAYYSGISRLCSILRNLAQGDGK